MEERDVVIIGGGPAGYTAAIQVSQLGGRSALIERDTIGGMCLNHGCIPTGALARAVELLDMGKNAKEYGITYKDVEVDFSKMMRRKDMVVKGLVAGVKQVLDGNGVEIIEGTGQLLSPTQLEVHLKDGTKRELKARRVILSTGSCYKENSFSEGGPKVIDPTQALKLTEIPRSLLIIGGGFIGAAFATIFSKLGTTVTFVEESSRILPQIDREIVTILEKEFKDNNIQIYSKAYIKNLGKGEKDDLNILLDVNGKEIKAAAQYVLLAEAREGNTEGLGLEEVGVKLNDKRGIAVNRRMETCVSGIFAVGDVTMEQMWTSVAYAEGITAAENALGRNSEIDYTAIPLWAHTIPEVSAVGMTEEEATNEGYEIRVGRFPFAGNGMVAILGQRIGIVKVIVDEHYGQILGVHIIGPRASDLIGEACLAMRLEVTPEEIRRTFHVHPSLSEALWEAARGM